MRNGGRILVFCFKNKSKNKSLCKAQPLKREKKKQFYKGKFILSQWFFIIPGTVLTKQLWNSQRHLFVPLQNWEICTSPTPFHKENLSTVSISKWRILPIKCPENLVLFLFYLFFVLFLVIKPETRFRGQIQKKN